MKKKNQIAAILGIGGVLTAIYLWYKQIGIGTNLTMSLNRTSFSIGEQAIASGRLVDTITNTGIAVKTIEVTVGGQPVASALTGSDGAFSTTLPAWVSPGNYSVKADFAGG